MKQVEIKIEELDWLRSNLKSVYLSNSEQPFDPNSYLKNYEGLLNTIQELVITLKKENAFVSTSLLRKLFYNTKDEASVIFRIGFIDACYLYITQGQYDRSGYHSKQAELENQKKVRQLVRRVVTRIFLYGFIFGSLLILALIQLGYIDWRTIPWVISTPPHHTLWECAYPNGTKTYNRMRNYRTYEEVQIYFDSRFRGDIIAGDCNAYLLDENGKHEPVCYDSIESIREFENEHGFPVSIKQIDMSPH